MWLKRLLLAAIVLALCVPQLNADAQQRTSSWLRPFQWKNRPDESVDQAPPEKLTTEPPSGQAGWNVFRWSNEPVASSKPLTVRPHQAAPLQQPTRSNAPLENTSSVIATDGPQQPDSVRTAVGEVADVPASSTVPVALERDAIDWPVTQTEKPGANQPADNRPGQGVNPFTWSNTAPKARQTIVPPQDFPALEQAQQPWLWSNDPRGRQKPQPMTPPEHPSFSSAVYDALSWAEERDPSQPDPLADSYPADDATDEELVEWEKQHFPWIRPFYWADEAQYEIAFDSEILPTDPTTIVSSSQSGGRSMSMDRDVKLPWEDSIVG